MNVLEFAIKMEHDGEEFYRKQAVVNKDNKLGVVFNMLADDEVGHGRIIRNMMAELSYELPGEDKFADAKNVFEDVDIKSIEISEQLDFYKMAADLEQKSIDLYKELLAKAKVDEERKVFEFLIKQEQQHLALMEELVLLLDHADEWVESAEFGNREEY